MRSRNVALLLVAIAAAGIAAYLTNSLSSPKGLVANSIYEFKINGIDGNQVDFARFKGKQLLIVNTASKCGKTPQYAGLEQLHEEYGGKVVVLGFPANNFLWQEPGTNGEIAAFCERNYGVRFQMFEKISVKGGDQHPLYRWLQVRTGEKPDWNFAKYLVSADGETVTFFKSSVQPLDPSLIGIINK